MLIYSCHHTHDEKSQVAEVEGCPQLHGALRNSTVLPPGSQADSHACMRTWPPCHSQALPLFSIRTLVDQLSPGKKSSGMHIWAPALLLTEHLVQPLVKSISCITHWPVQWLNTAREDQVSDPTPALSDTCCATPSRTHLRGY